MVEKGPSLINGGEGVTIVGVARKSAWEKERSGSGAGCGGDGGSKSNDRNIGTNAQDDGADDV